MKSIHKIYLFGAASFILIKQNITRIIEDQIYGADGGADDILFEILFLSAAVSIGIIYTLTQRSINKYFKAVIIGAVLPLASICLSLNNDISIAKLFFNLLGYSLLTSIIFSVTDLFEDSSFPPPSTNTSSDNNQTRRENRDSSKREWEDIERKKRYLEVDIRNAEWSLSHLKTNIYNDEIDQTHAQINIRFEENRIWQLKSELNDLERKQRNL